MLRNITLSFLVVVGCGGKTIDPLQDGGTNDGAPKQDAVVLDVTPPPPPPLDGAPPPQCNDIDPGTKTLSVLQVPQNPPPFAGTSTSINPGLYELISLVIYTGPNGPSGSTGSIAGQIRVNVANSADYIFEVATVQDNQAPMQSSSDGNIAGPGVLTIAQTCPEPQQAVKVLYSADSSTFTIRVDAGNQTAEEKFVFVGQ